MSPSSARALFLIKRAQTACRTGLDKYLADFEITPAQYTVLSLLGASKSQSSADVARQAGVSPQSMGEIINHLERLGLVERFENPEHRRMLKIHLTGPGRETLDQCERQVDELEATLLDGLKPKEIGALKDAMQILIRNAQANDL